MARFLVLLVLLATCSSVFAHVKSQELRLTYEEALLRPHQLLASLEDVIRRKTLLNNSKPLPKLNFIPDLKTLKAKSPISLACNLSLLYLVTHPTSKWSIAISDATGKTPSGLAEGALHWLGNFDQCFANEPPTDYFTTNPPRSHYCQVSIKIPYYPPTTSIDIGICAPDTCSAPEVAFYTNMSAKGAYFVRPGTFCWKRPENIPLSTGAIVMTVICGITVLLILLSTACDIFLRRGSSNTGEAKVGRSPVNFRNAESEVAFRDDDELSSSDDEMPVEVIETPKIRDRLAVSFSLRTHLEGLLDMTQKSGRLNCLDGIRFLSMAWIILGHTFAFIIFGYTAPNGVVNNILYFVDLFKKWSYQTILNATFSVDTFFLLSGLLTSYFFLKEAEKAGTICNLKLWVLFFVHRFWRLTPVYMLWIGSHTFLVGYLGTGPFWNQTSFFQADYCKKYWWTNLLYVNNLVHAKEMCVGWTWFLAIDMQLHVFIAPWILSGFFFARRESWGRTLWRVALPTALCLPTLLTSLISSGVIYKVDLDRNATAEDLNLHSYITPWCRMSPYVVGLVLGVLILVHEKEKIRLHWSLVCLGWLISAGSCLAVLYGLSGVAAGTYKNSNSVTALYWAMSRFSWSVGVSWVIFACLAGYAGWVNSLLSWPGFIPLSRLTYCAYLVHPTVIAAVYSALRQPQVLTSFGMVCFFFAHLLLAFLVAAVVSLAWEAPFRSLERALLRKS